MAGVNAELVPEFAKDKVWEGNVKTLANQAYVFGESSTSGSQDLKER